MTWRLEFSRVILHRQIWGFYSELLKDSVVGDVSSCDWYVGDFVIWRCVSLAEFLSAYSNTVAKKLGTFLPASNSELRIILVTTWQWVFKLQTAKYVQYDRLSFQTSCASCRNFPKYSMKPLAISVQSQSTDTSSYQLHHARSAPNCCMSESRRHLWEINFRTRVTLCGGSSEVALLREEYTWWQDRGAAKCAKDIQVFLLRKICVMALLLVCRVLDHFQGRTLVL